MKNSNDTVWNRNSKLPICSTALLPLSYRGPLTSRQQCEYITIYYNIRVCFRGPQQFRIILMCRSVDIKIHNIYFTLTAACFVHRNITFTRYSRYDSNITIIYFPFQIMELLDLCWPDIYNFTVPHSLFIHNMSKGYISPIPNIYFTLTAACFGLMIATFKQPKHVAVMCKNICCVFDCLNFYIVNRTVMPYLKIILLCPVVGQPTALAVDSR